MITESTKEDGEQEMDASSSHVHGSGGNVHETLPNTERVITHTMQGIEIGEQEVSSNLIATDVEGLALGRDLDGNLTTPTAIHLLDETIGIVQNFKEVIHKRSDDGKEVSTLEMLETLSQILENGDRKDTSGSSELTSKGLPIQNSRATKDALTALADDSMDDLMMAFSIDGDGECSVPPSASSGALPSSPPTDGAESCHSSFANDSTSPESVSVPQQNDVDASMIANDLELGYSGREQEGINNAVKDNALTTVATSPQAADGQEGGLSEYHVDNDGKSSLTPPISLSPILKPSRSPQHTDDKKHQVSFTDEAIPESRSVPGSVTFSKREDLEDPISGDLGLGDSMHEEQERIAFSGQNNERVSKVRDLSSGKVGGARMQHALLRSQTACAPRSKSQRNLMEVQNFLGLPTNRGMQNQDKDGKLDDVKEEKPPMQSQRFLISSQDAVEKRIDVQQEPTKQYRLKALKPPTKQQRLLKWLGLAENKLTIYENTDGSDSFEMCGLKPNQLVMRYIQWAFRTSFVSAFLSGAAFFALVTLVFAIAIYAETRRQPECIVGATPDTDDYTGPEGGMFMDSFQLSWQTLGSVGYGAVCVSNHRDCIALSMIVSLEAFAGLCFISFCCAVIYAKVSRIQSFAQVKFSDVMVLRYGVGVGIEYDQEPSIDADEETPALGFRESGRGKIPCPILEFRINNSLHSIPGGEIMDASLNLVAVIDATQACPTSRAPVQKSRSKRRRRGVRRNSAAVARRQKIHRNEPGLGGSDLGEAFSSSSSLDTVFDPMRPGTKQTQEIDEDPTGNLVPKRIFAKLEVETPDHPFFRRVWVVRHRLDEYSPLLKTDARQMVRLNQGYWPHRLNSYNEVKKSIDFDQILVNFSGTSNAAANPVYTQKAYEPVDICVGYQFVDQLYRDERDDCLRVDTRLINDIVEQNGGGGEPLKCSEDSHHAAAPDLIMVL